MRFSERYGYKQLRDSIQLESMDEPLRNGLWSLLQIMVWNDVYCTGGGFDLLHDKNRKHYEFFTKIWMMLFKRRIDEMSPSWSSLSADIKAYFFSCKWYEVYDFVEFVCEHYEDAQFQEVFPVACNALMREENSGYRLSSGKFIRITDSNELDEVDEAVSQSDGPVEVHLRRAVELMSDRNNPDYRNSIKESISAVESICSIVMGGEGGTLGQLIKKMEKEKGLTPSLAKSLSSLYGYTSGTNGIRHALLEESNLDFYDAKYALVVCAAFINLVRAKFG